MATQPPESELERAFGWMAEVGAEDALRDQDAERLAQAARHAAIVVERDALVGGPLWEKAGDRLLLDAWLSAQGVTRQEFDSWTADRDAT